MKMNRLIHALSLTLMAIGGAQAQSQSGSAVPVTVENFIRAESDSYFVGLVNGGRFGKFFHRREPVPADSRGVIRPNRDTLYSGAVFDLDAGPVTISLPDAGNRYLPPIVWMVEGALSEFKECAECPSSGRVHHGLAFGRAGCGEAAPRDDRGTVCRK